MPLIYCSVCCCCFYFQYILHNYISTWLEVSKVSLVSSTLPAVDMTHLQTSGSEPDENVSLFYDRIMKLSVRNMQSWGCIGWWLTVTEYCVGTHVTARVYSQLPLVQRVRLTRRVSHSDVTINFSHISAIFPPFWWFSLRFQTFSKKENPLAPVTALTQVSFFHLHQKLKSHDRLCHSVLWFHIMEDL